MLILGGVISYENRSSLTLQLAPLSTLQGPSTSTASKLRRAASKRSGALRQGLGGNTPTVHPSGGDMGPL